MVTTTVLFFDRRLFSFANEPLELLKWLGTICNCYACLLAPISLRRRASGPLLLAIPLDLSTRHEMS
jgi:hypothetical protein